MGRIGSGVLASVSFHSDPVYFALLSQFSHYDASVRWRTDPFLKMYDSLISVRSHITSVHIGLLVFKLSQRDRAMARVIEYFAKSFQGHSRSFEMTPMSTRACVSPY